MRRRRVLVIGRAWGYYGIAIVWRIDPSHVTSTSLLVFEMTVIVVSRVHLIARKGWMGETLLVWMVCRIRSREMGHVVVMLWGWNLFWKMRWSWTSTARNGWNWARWRLAVCKINEEKSELCKHYFSQSKQIKKCLHLLYDISRGTYSYVKQGFQTASLCNCSVSGNWQAASIVDDHHNKRSSSPPLHEGKARIGNDLGNS